MALRSTGKFPLLAAELAKATRGGVHAYGTKGLKWTFATKELGTLFENFCHESETAIELLDANICLLKIVTSSAELFVSKPSHPTSTKDCEVQISKWEGEVSFRNKNGEVITSHLSMCGPTSARFTPDLNEDGYGIALFSTFVRFSVDLQRLFNPWQEDLLLAARKSGVCLDDVPSGFRCICWDVSELIKDEISPLFFQFLGANLGERGILLDNGWGVRNVQFKSSSPSIVRMIGNSATLDLHGTLCLEIEGGEEPRHYLDVVDVIVCEGRSTNQAKVRNHNEKATDRIVKKDLKVIQPVVRTFICQLSQMFTEGQEARNALRLVRELESNSQPSQMVTEGAKKGVQGARELESSIPPSSPSQTFPKGQKAGKAVQGARELESSQPSQMFTEGPKKEVQSSSPPSQMLTEGQKPKKEVQEAHELESSSPPRFTEGQKPKKEGQEAHELQSSSPPRFTEGQKPKKEVQEALELESSNPIESKSKTTDETPGVPGREITIRLSDHLVAIHGSWPQGMCVTVSSEGHTQQVQVTQICEKLHGLRSCGCVASCSDQVRPCPLD